MTVVLVHGNPETAAVWGPLVDALASRGVTGVVRLSPPGFGAALPDDFPATVDAYRDWLIGELETIAVRDGPVDLVGHDWGGGHAVTVAMARPDLLRSWVSDVIGIFDPGYVWHDLAQTWQTPGAGESAVEAWFGPERKPEALVAGLASRGLPEPVAREVVAGQDEAMGRAVLALYRDAAQPRLAELGADLESAAQRPGLALLATEDTMVGTDEQRRTAATRAGARVEVLDGLGHWWMGEDPVRGAGVLADFWADC
ncbi:alpha/beta fold hydrolase [Actinomycetospora sp. C-140]